MNNVRPLRWHDLPFAYRLAGHGMSFDAHLRLTIGEDHLRHAQLTGIGRTQIFVLRRRGSGAMASLHYPDGVRHARLAYLAPSLTEGADEDLWLAMLDGLTAQAGKRGTFSIAAEVDDHGPALEVMRHADFAIYARQDVWLREPAPTVRNKVILRKARADHEMELLGLYSALVPPLIKQVEPKPISADVCYVLDGKEGPTAMVAVHEGKHGALMEVYLHPEVEHEAREVIHAALYILEADKQQVYVRLRRYMGWLESSLDDLGFERAASQAVMVRHTTARIKARDEFQSIRSIDGAAVPNSMTEVRGKSNQPATFTQGTASRP
jgi:hypothetical protein